MKLKIDQDKKITVLLNSVYFFIEHVYVLFLDKTYKLIVIHDYELLINKEYKTLRGAKIAFIKFFGYKAYEDEKPLWSSLFYPILDWHENKIAKTRSRSKRKKNRSKL
ncbi:MAG: hypothetical protein MUF15_25580 [Acidobacteria bacterium]|jgi:hypothetical protein|nr:hypothetical protein [Acidobacteriota bacterium]